MTTDTITPADVAQLKERAVYLMTEHAKLLRAGSPTRRSQERLQAALDAAMAAGVPLREISRESDEQFIQYIKDCWEPGYEATLDETGDHAPVAA